MAVAERLSLIDRLKKYLADVKVEMTKVSWPSRQEAREATTVVLFAVLIISIFIYSVDLLVGRIVRAVL
jgi:preprotein translocase subunit SecE